MSRRKKPETTISIDGGTKVGFDEFKSRLQNAVHGYGIAAVENHLLRAMAENGAKDLISAISENEPEILDDIARISEDAGPAGKIKFKISFGVTLDLEKSRVLTAFGYSSSAPSNSPIKLTRLNKGKWISLRGRNN